MSEEIICGIYKITSPSGKIYVGQSYDIEKRFYKYRSLNCKWQPYLYNSLKKHGVENHNFEIIHKCLESKLDHFENYYIGVFDSFNSEHGMNLRSGGGRGEKLSDESKKKSGESQKINWVKRRNNGTDKQSAGTIQKRIASYKETLKKNKDKGILRKHTEERKKMIGVKAKEYQIKIKDSPEYYSEEQIQKRKNAARKAVETKIKNGTTCLNKKRTPLFGKDNHFYGKKHSKETLDKISDKGKAAAARRRENGYTQSKEHIEKRVKKQTGKKRTDEQKKRMKDGVDAMKQSTNWVNHRNKMSESQKLVWERKKNGNFYSDEEKSKRTIIANKIWAKRRENKKAA